MGALRALIWPDKPAEFDGDGLALLLVALPRGTLRAHARQLARQASREALGGLLSLSAEDVVLVEGPHGPLLEDPVRDIRISLSYAGDWALIGVAEGRALGVDMVRIENLPEAEALSRFYLPTATRRALLAVPPEMRDVAFAQGWAQMEACGKCLGLPLLEIGAEREQALKGCSFVACEQMDGYRIAVAVKQSVKSLAGAGLPSC